MADRTRFQFSLVALFVFVGIVSVLLAAITVGGQSGICFGLPVAWAGIVVLLGADRQGLRRLCLLLAGCAAILCLLLAGDSYPIIVIADSDLSIGAMARVGDWMRLFCAYLALVVLIAVARYVSRMVVRLGLVLGLLCWAVTLPFQSPYTPAGARIALLTLVALLLASEGLATVTKRFPGCPSHVRAMLVMAMPALLVVVVWFALKPK